MDRAPEVKKPNIGQIAVGIDLTDTYSQVSFGYVEGSGVETLSTVAGSNNYRIPTALFKRKEVNQWFAGKDAVKNMETEGYYIDRLVSRAVSGEDIVVGEETFRPSQLLALFLKRTLSIVSMAAPINAIVSFMVTVADLDERMVNVLSEAVAGLGLKTENIFFQSHMESFYYYMIYQDKMLWERDVLLLDFTGDCVKSYRLECNKNTTPIVAFIDQNTYPSFGTRNIENIAPDSMEAKNYDSRLVSIIEESTENRMFSSLFMIGDAFNQNIFSQSVKLLCKKGRVFEGNNLYSKGAAFSAKDRLVKAETSLSHVFLGNDKLKSNVGFNVVRRGENVYMALLDGGINWYEASSECEIILDKGNKISFVITPLTGKNPELVDVILTDLPKRPPKTTRLKVSISMLSESKMQVVIKDLGFGELFASSNIEWKEVILV